MPRACVTAKGGHIIIHVYIIEVLSGVEQAEFRRREVQLESLNQSVVELTVRCEVIMTPDRVSEA